MPLDGKCTGSITTCASYNCPLGPKNRNLCEHYLIRPALERGACTLYYRMTNVLICVPPLVSLLRLHGRGTRSDHGGESNHKYRQHAGSEILGRRESEETRAVTLPALTSDFQFYLSSSLFEPTILLSRGAIRYLLYVGSAPL